MTSFQGDRVEAEAVCGTSGLDILSVYSRDVNRYALLTPEEEIEKTCHFRAVLDDFTANIRSYPRFWQIALERATDLRCTAQTHGDEHRYPAEPIERLERLLAAEQVANQFGASKEPLRSYRERVERGTEFEKILGSFPIPIYNIDDHLVFGRVVQQDYKELQSWQANVAALLGRKTNDPGMVQIIDDLTLALRRGTEHFQTELQKLEGKIIKREEREELKVLIDLFNIWRTEQGLGYGSFVQAAELTEHLTGEMAARRDDLVNPNLRLARYFALRRYSSWKRGCPELRFDVLDVIQEANIGLISGINRFEPEKGFRLSTYLTWWIKQRMSRFFQDHASIVRLPVHIRDRDSQLAQMRVKTATELGHGMSAEGVYAVKRLLQDDASFSGRLRKAGYRYVRNESELADPGLSGEDPNPDPIGAHEAGSTAATQVTAAIRRESVNEIEKIVTMMERENPRLGAIIRLRHGLWDGNCLTLEEIGARFAVTRERIRQLETKAHERFEEIYRTAGMEIPERSRQDRASE